MSPFTLSTVDLGIFLSKFMGMVIILEDHICVLGHMFPLIHVLLTIHHLTLKFIYKNFIVMLEFSSRHMIDGLTHALDSCDTIVRTQIIRPEIMLLPLLRFTI